MMSPIADHPGLPVHPDFGAADIPPRLQNEWKLWFGLVQKHLRRSGMKMRHSFKVVGNFGGAPLAFEAGEDSGSYAARALAFTKTMPTIMCRSYRASMSSVPCSPPSRIDYDADLSI